LKKTQPQKHRIRVGEYRIIYLIEDNTVHVIEVFRRGRGYSE
jgi:mRNA-degrading endonuclease RelE of RelBE toxin-antitoxin system